MDSTHFVVVVVVVAAIVVGQLHIWNIKTGCLGVSISGHITNEFSNFLVFPVLFFNKKHTKKMRGKSNNKNGFKKKKKTMKQIY